MTQFLAVLATIQKYQQATLIIGGVLLGMGFIGRLIRKLRSNQTFSSRDEGRGEESRDSSETADFSKAQSVFRRMQT